MRSGIFISVLEGIPSTYKCGWQSVITQQVFLEIMHNFFYLSHIAQMNLEMIFDFQRAQLYDVVCEALHKVVSNFSLPNLTKYQVFIGYEIKIRMTSK